MNRLGLARQAILDAIAPVLSGRTYPYPPGPTEARVAPAVWVGEHRGFASTIGERTNVKIAVFPIFVVYDGADRAQVAGLDEIESGIMDAVAHVPGAEVSAWNPQPVDPSANRRMVIIDVDYMITATTLCLPDVGGDVVHGPDDVVEGSADVIFTAPIRADVPPDPADIPTGSGQPIEPPDLIPNP